MLGESAGNWQAFAKVSYQGPHVTLNQGQQYSTPSQMGLNGPVKSMRKAV